MKWRKRYAQYGIEGLHDEQRPDRPRTHDDDRVAEVMNTALQSVARAPHALERAGHGGANGRVEKHRPTVVRPVRRATASATHVQAVQRPVLCREEVRDIVGLYLHPPDKAVVLYVDEKTQIQALDRTQPMLPMGLGYARKE